MSVPGFNAAAVHQSDGVAEFAVAPDKYHLPCARCSNQITRPRCVVHPRMEPRDLQYWVHLLAKCENNLTDGRRK